MPKIGHLCFPIAFFWPFSVYPHGSGAYTALTKWWGFSRKKYDQKLEEKFRQIAASIEQVAKEDEEAEQEGDFQEKLEASPITSEKIEAVIEQVEERLKKEPKNRTLKKAKRQLEQDLLPRKKKYEEYKERLGERNSFPKTDPNATFMRMKDDHMKNGQLKPGYNVQIGTENQFITGFSVHQRAGDAGCFIPHLEQLAAYGRPMPKRAIADSAYGSEENYTYCEKKKIVALIKYNTLDWEQTKAWAKEIGRIENMTYDEELDEWICAKGERLVFVYERKETTDNGYVTVKRTYRCTACAGCPFQTACAKGKETKTIRVSLKNQQQRQEIRERLSTEEGAATYRRRQIENEPVFGQIKHNQQFQRFLLRGLPKITVEWGLICATHNLRKWAATTDPTRKKQDKIQK